MTLSDKQIAQSLMTFAMAQGPGIDFSPADVARGLSEDWRPLVPRICEISKSLPLRITRKHRLLSLLSDQIHLSLLPQTSDQSP